ncbi:hypothetical protein P154DRAFT_483193 [Amniculicola lignicola CBS 123094]|uniref:C2H2-type domain-containing protein n=1 Tax=Amniculicola lignicola CBS 123094 TaxID=1392246 RepID=A0A6A5WX76_9PLEO|nr:hypothetical protein P154DRAFT_483193 [Amniculicola lignicola CBS 123094]
MSNTQTLTIPTHSEDSVAQDALHKTTVSDLPEEIVDGIFRILRDTVSPAEYWNYLKICRRFHRIGLGVHGRLDYAVSTIVESQTRRQELSEEKPATRISISTDYSLKPASQQFISQLRSLTIHVLHPRIATPFIRTPGLDLFEALSQTFLVTRKLSTFSLKFSDEGWDFPHLDVPAIPQSRLARLVAALPPTVLNLELDTAGTDIPPTTNLMKMNEESHFCYQVSKIFSRLKYLRLRVGHLCNNLLAPGAPRRERPREMDCECCKGDTQLACLVSKTWNMRRLVLWLPWGQTLEDGSISDLHFLTKLNPNHGTLVTVVSQVDRAYPPRLGIDNPPRNVYCDFEWAAGGNYHTFSHMPVENDVVKVFGKSDRNHRAGIPIEPTHTYTPCAEHLAMCRTPQRRFSIGTYHYPETPYSAMAQWDLEKENRWAQDGHGGCRYPIAEGDQHDKHGLERGAGLFACIFPKCQKRVESLTQLRGHLMYSHPENPHDDVYYRAHPCPSIGCARVGLWGFYRLKELEEHLLSHHLRPCPTDPGDYHLYSRLTVPAGRVYE